MRASIVCSLYLGLIKCLFSGNNDNIEFPNTRLLFPVCIRTLDKVIRVKVPSQSYRLLGEFCVFVWNRLHGAASHSVYKFLSLCDMYRVPHTVRAHTAHTVITLRVVVIGSDCGAQIEHLFYFIYNELI